jgi:hypothetical protein
MSVVSKCDRYSTVVVQNVLSVIKTMFARECICKKPIRDTAVNCSIPTHSEEGWCTAHKATRLSLHQACLRRSRCTTYSCRRGARYTNRRYHFLLIYRVKFPEVMGITSVGHALSNRKRTSLEFLSTISEQPVRHDSTRRITVK